MVGLAAADQKREAQQLMGGKALFALRNYQVRPERETAQRFPAKVIHATQEAPKNLRGTVVSRQNAPAFLLHGCTANGDSQSLPALSTA